MIIMPERPRLATSRLCNPALIPASRNRRLLALLWPCSEAACHAEALRTARKPTPPTKREIRKFLIYNDMLPQHRYAQHEKQRR